MKRNFPNRVLHTGGGTLQPFEQVYAQYYSIVFRYMLSLSGDISIAEDITQEAFIKAMSHMDQFDGKCQLYVWICQIAKNTYFSFLRKHEKQMREKHFFPQFHDPEEQYLQKETISRIYSQMKLLPEPYSEVFSLRVLGELSFSQIGSIYGKTDSWARLIFFRAKQKLRENIDESDNV